MKTLIKNGRIVTEVDDDKAADRTRRSSMVGKGGLYVIGIRTGVMLNSTTDSIDKVIEALDAGFRTL